MLNASLPQTQTTPAVPIGMKKAQESVAGKMGADAGAPAIPGATIQPPPLEKKDDNKKDGKSDDKKTGLPELKKKFPLKYIVGGILLVLLLVGAGVGFYLSQQQQDVRQQASGASCNWCAGSNQCPHEPAGVDFSVCDNEDGWCCEGYSAGGTDGGVDEGSSDAQCGSWTVECCDGQRFSTATSDDECQTQSNFGNQAAWKGEACRGSRGGYGGACQGSGDADRCAADPGSYGVFGTAGIGDSCCGDGRIECATGFCSANTGELGVCVVDSGQCLATNQPCNTGTCCDGLACQGTTDSKICQDTGASNLNDLCDGGGTCTGYISFQCDSLSVTTASSGVPNCIENGSSIGSNQIEAANRASEKGCGQWDQVCVGGDTPGKLCGSFEIINTSCGGGGGGETPTATCNQSCTENANCITAGQSCDPATNTCRLTANPTSATCSAVPTTVACNEACTTDANCADPEHRCLEGVCRQQENPSSEVCLPLASCNETCDDVTVGCFGALNFCDPDTNTCRLEVNPTSTTCQGVPTVGCNETCVTSDDCANVDHVCQTEAEGTGVCRLEENPLSETCEALAVATCNEPCTEDGNCTTEGQSCDATTATCRLTTNTTSEICEVAPEPVGCNDTCEVDADCENSDHSCDEDTESCRLTENPGDDNCQPAADPDPSPEPGCNEECTSNAECTNSSAICYDNLCRLSTNPVSTSCQPKTIVKGGAGTYYEQPALPAALPKSGSNWLLNGLKVGLGILGLGLLFLFL